MSKVGHYRAADIREGSSNHWRDPPDFHDEGYCFKGCDCQRECSCNYWQECDHPQLHTCKEKPESLEGVREFSLQDLKDWKNNRGERNTGEGFVPPGIHSFTRNELTNWALVQQKYRGRVDKAFYEYNIGTDGTLGSHELSEVRLKLRNTEQGQLGAIKYLDIKPYQNKPFLDKLRQAMLFVKMLRVSERTTSDICSCGGEMVEKHLFVSKYMECSKCGK